MASIVLAGSSSGSITVAAPAAAGSTTLTLPASTSTLATTTDITGPAFYAKPSAAQTLSSGTWTTIAFNTEDYDTNSNYNTGTYAFTPTVAGYYYFTAVIRSTGGTSRFYTKFLLNGTTSYYGNDFNFAASSLNSNYSALIYMNGSGDSVVSQLFIQGASLATGNGPMAFSAFLARKA